MVDLKKLLALPERSLLAAADSTAVTERESIADMVCYIAALETKGTRKACGYSSMFEMCVRRWRYSREAAAQRTKAARVLILHDDVAVWLRSGELSLCSAAMLEPYVKEHGLPLLQRALGKNAAEVGKIIAEIDPRAEPSDLIRTSAVRPAATTSAVRPDGIGLGAEPTQQELSAETQGAEPPRQETRVLFKFVASEELRGLIQRAKDLLWHKYPFGDLEFIVGEAMKRLVEELEKGLLGVPDAAGRPSKRRQRRIPKWVRRLVWERDGGRCSFIHEDGTRCGTTTGLEFDHIKPWAEGGSSDDPDNLRILCDGHNRLEAEKRFGPFRPDSSSRAARPPS